MNASDYRQCLSSTTFSHLQECCIALDEKQHLAAVVWGAVFLEAFLADLADELGLPRGGQDDLNGRIQQLRQYNKNPPSNRPAIPEEVVNRCHDIRSTRNRLVHDMGMGKSTLEDDARYVTGGLKVILDWYRTLPRPAKSGDSSSSSPPAEAGIPVFVSTITPDHPRQRYFLDMLLARLQGIGIRPVRAVFDEFDRADPIGLVMERIQECRALIVIGLERSHAYFLREREGTPKEKEEVHRKFTSGWLHLEAGIAHALRLRIFVLRQEDVCNDGIFDDSWNSYPVIKLPSLDEDCEKFKLFLEKVQAWATDERRRSTSMT